MTNPLSEAYNEYTIETETELVYDAPKLNKWQYFWNVSWKRFWGSKLGKLLSLVIFIAATILAIFCPAFTPYYISAVLGTTVSLVIGATIAGFRNKESFVDGFNNYINEELAPAFAISLTLAMVSFGVSKAVQAIQNAAPKCFKAGTLVACLDQAGKETLKPIEEIEVGDKVLAYDEETGEQCYKEVVRLFRNKTQEWHHVFVNGEEIVCTAEHPFYVEGKGFVPARELKERDNLLLSDGSKVEIDSLRIEHVEIPETTYNFEVKDFLGYDPQEGSFYYTSNEESPMRTAVYKTDRKGKKLKLSTQQGTNSAQFSTDMKYYLNRYTSLDTPLVITLNNNRGQVLTTLVDNQKLRAQLAEYNLPKKEFFSFTTTDGTQLNGWMMKPTDFSPSKKYPALQYQYSGPGSQQVLDAFGISWETFMASQGYVVVCVDGRGTGGRGADFEKCTYLNLGVKEARDQVETALYLGSLPYVDKNRIGIWGWSFGGYMTIMSMSEGTPVFKAGVAVAAVTDWNYYDTVYGERFMRTPQENAEGYKVSSAFTRADKLNGHLLLVHGMADDNVHYQNCAEYAEHLVQLGKQFDMQVYTNRNHSIFGGNTRMHLYTRLTEFFNQWLMGN